MLLLLFCFCLSSDKLEIEAFIAVYCAYELFYELDLFL